MKHFYTQRTVSNLLIILLICILGTNLYGQIPTISSFSPMSGSVGTTVTISGTNFNTTQESNIVFFGATRAAVTSATETTLSVTVPIGSTYDYISLLNTDNGLMTNSNSKFTPSPSPNSGGINPSDFVLPVYFSAVEDALRVGIADFDGDGKPDFALPGLQGMISILRNTSTIGTLTFDPSINLPARSNSNNSEDISVGDLDGDGKPDIVSSYTIATINPNNSSSYVSYISVYRNTSTPGTISFANRVDYGEQPFLTGGVTKISDIDGDGKQDIVLLIGVVNLPSLVLRNTSSPGTISFADPVNLNEPNVIIKGLQAGDLDGDNKPDLIFPHYLSAQVSVLRNTSVMGTVGFAQNVTFPVAQQSWWEQVSIGDIDGDGLQDIAAVSYQFSISILRNISTVGSLDFEDSYTIDTNENSYWIPLGDINGDGKVDMATIGAGYNKLLLYQNESTPGNISFAAEVEIPGTASLRDLKIVDVDGDGRPELVGAASQLGALVIYKNSSVGLGIEEISKDSNLVIYPNPVKDHLTIKSNGNIHIQSIEIRDVSGRILQTINPDLQSEATINVSHLSAGNYFLKVQSENGMTVKKFIKL